MERGEQRRRRGWFSGGMALGVTVLLAAAGCEPGEMPVAGAPQVAQGEAGSEAGPPYAEPSGPRDPETGPELERSDPGTLEHRAPVDEDPQRFPPAGDDEPPIRPLPGAPPPSSIPEGLVNGHVFGRDVYGLSPEMLQRLQSAERAMIASGEAEGSTPEERFGVASISGYRPGSRGHSRGVAVDINYYVNPYIMHEKGESALDAQLARVYDRIARVMLGRDSVIPEQITEGSPNPERAMRLYQQLREESRAMAAYFNLMQDRDAIARHLRSLRQPIPAADIPSSPEALQQQMAADYVTLSGRPGPYVEGLTYPEPEPAPRADGRPSDRPFQGDPQYRAPELGFMNLRPNLVQALTDAGLRWGAIDFGGQSGDVMHFYLPDNQQAQR